MSRSETIIKMFIKSSEEVQKEVLSLFNEEEKEIFLTQVGLYKMFNDSQFYNTVQNAIAKQFYEECNQ